MKITGEEIIIPKKFFPTIFHSSRILSNSFRYKEKKNNNNNNNLTSSILFLSLSLSSRPKSPFQIARFKSELGHICPCRGPNAPTSHQPDRGNIKFLGRSARWKRRSRVGVDAVEQCGERGLNLIRPSPERHRQRGGFEVEGCRPTSTDRYSYRCPKPYPFLLPSAREKKRKKKKKISALSFSSSSLTPSSSPNSFSSSSLTPPQFLSSLTCAFESEIGESRNGANGYEERNETKGKRDSSIDIATGVQKYASSWNIREMVRLERKNHIHYFRCFYSRTPSYDTVRLEILLDWDIKRRIYERKGPPPKGFLQADVYIYLKVELFEVFLKL